MVHLVPARTALVLFLSLIALESFFALALRDTGMTVHEFSEVYKNKEEFGEVKSTAVVGISSSSSSSRRWAHRGRKMGKKLRRRIPHSRVQYQFDGLVAFSSDYHVPKSHPPKNN